MKLDRAWRSSCLVEHLIAVRRSREASKYLCSVYIINLPYLFFLFSEASIYRFVKDVPQCKTREKRKESKELYIQVLNK